MAGPKQHKPLARPPLRRIAHPSLTLHFPLVLTLRLVSAFFKAFFMDSQAPFQGRPKQKQRLLRNPKARLRDQFHEVARFKHQSLRTEGAYWEWVVRYDFGFEKGGPGAKIGL